MENFLYNNFLLIMLSVVTILPIILVAIVYGLNELLDLWQLKRIKENKSLEIIHFIWILFFLSLTGIGLKTVSNICEFLSLSGEINSNYFFEITKSNTINIYQKTKIEETSKEFQLTEEKLELVTETKTIYENKKNILVVKCNLDYNQCVDKIKENITKLVADTDLKESTTKVVSF